jgi:8-oxo-dGTP pyrophosphatase MutT (NUDIX family)/phosphohistidine phosphatase SixA
MPDGDPADQIRAAGAVLWRPAGRGVQVALVHRPKYDDWSFAKGKLEPGEHVLLAAEREVREETGLRITLGRRLPPVRYLVDGLRKRVDYWVARASASSGQFVANSEVDRVDWVAAGQAGRRLSYDHDVQLLTDFCAGPRQTVPLILVRHASAGAKSQWAADDQARPLDEHGQQQATALSRLLACFGAGRVLSSPAERCVATVRPFADCTGAQVEVEPAFGVPDASAKKSVRQAAAEALGQAAARAAASAAADDRPVVICAHRENIPRMLAAVCDRLGAAVPAGPPLRKAGFWVLHRAAGQLAGAERHHPEDDD